MTHYIYLTKNKINGKVYIGKRKCPANKTPLSDNYIGSGVILRKAIKKHGKENFEKIILYSDISDVKILNELEKTAILKYNSTDRNIGYNRTLGGDGGNVREFYFFYRDNTNLFY